MYKETTVPRGKHIKTWGEVRFRLPTLEVRVIPKLLSHLLLIKCTSKHWPVFDFMQRFHAIEFALLLSGLKSVVPSSDLRRVAVTVRRAFFGCRSFVDWLWLCESNRMNELQVLSERQGQASTLTSRSTHNTPSGTEQVGCSPPRAIRRACVWTVFSGAPLPPAVCSG